MVNLFDTHAHLDSEQLFKDAKTIVETAQNAGVKWIMSACSGDGIESIKKTVSV